MGLTDRLRGPGPMRQRAAGLTLAAVIGLLAVSATLAAPPGQPQAWFDAPLPGATLPLTPYQVVVHATDDSGIAKVKFQVDGTPAATQTPSAPGDLVTVSWAWTPAGEGEHTITAVAEGIDGSLSAPVAVAVFIDIDAGPLPTPDVSPSASASGEPTATPLASGATPGPTATPRPTTAPTPAPTPIPTPECRPPSPELIAPDDFYLVIDSVPGENPPTFEWVMSAICHVTGFHIAITNADHQPIDDGFVGPSVRAWTPGSPLPVPGGRDCTPPIIYWSVWTQVDGVDLLQSEVRRLVVACP